MKTPKELKTLKEKMVEIKDGNLDVEADNPKIVKCWERLNCNKTDCPAYGKLRCWSITGTFCHDEVQGVFAKKLGDCRKCVVYQESCGDEIGELLETFNLMVKDLKFARTSREISDRKKAQEEQRSRIEDLSETLAHEVRNPLHSIRMATTYLKQNFEGELITEFLSVIEEEIKRLQNLTNVFLDFSHPAPVVKEPIDINRLIKSTLELISDEAEADNIKVCSALDIELPPVTSDAAQIKQALLYLLTNALEASGSGGTVEVGSKKEESFALITVQDSGPGMSSETIKNIFKPFFTTKTRGPGLGLTIVQRIVEEHDGSVSVENIKDGGALFSIHLPY